MSADADKSQPGPQPDTDEVAILIDEKIGRRFRRRANFYLASAIFIGLIVIITLIVSTYIFFNANSISGGGGSIDQILEVQSERENAEKLIPIVELELFGTSEENEVGQSTVLDVLAVMEELAEVRVKAALLLKKEELANRYKYTSAIDEIETKEEIKVLIEQYKKYVADLESLRTRINNKIEMGEATRTSLSQVDRYLTSAKSLLELYEIREQNLNSVIEVNSNIQKIDIANLISSNIVRFGGVIIALFLVKILVPVYRYNTRLAGFYMAIADAIALRSSLTPSSFKIIAEVLIPTYEYDEGPQTPVESLSSLIKDVASAAKR